MERTEFRLEPLIERQAVASLQDRGYRSPIRLSSTGGCMRRTAFEAAGREGIAPDDMKARYFATGHKVGKAYVDRWQNHVDEEEWHIMQSAEAELYLYVDLEPAVRDALIRKQAALDPHYRPRIGADGRFGVPGHTDLITCHNIGDPSVLDRRLITDFKTIKKGFKGRELGKGFGFVSLDEDDYTTCSEDYLMQIGAYQVADMDMLGIPPEDAEERYLDPRLIYECKDDQKTKEMIVPIEAAIEYGEIARRRWHTLLEAIATDYEVAPEYQPGDWQCNYCPMALQCWGDRITNTTPKARIPKWAFKEGHDA